MVEPDNASALPLDRAEATLRFSSTDYGFSDQGQSVVDEISHAPAIPASTAHPTETMKSSSSVSTDSSHDIVAEPACLASIHNHQHRHHCSVCFDPVHESAALVCECAVCKLCVTTHLQTQLQRGRVDPLECPSCDSVLSTDYVKAMLPEDLVRRYDKLYQAFQENKEVQSNPALRWCPNANCNTVIHKDKHSIMKRTEAQIKSLEFPVECPTCQTVFCFGCSSPPHPKLSCSQNHSIRLKQMGKTEEAAFHKWAKKYTRLCPEKSCRVAIERDRENTDCNHMTCWSCRTEFCWLCGSKVPPIGHFDADNVLGCPGMQFSGPDATFTERARAKLGAFRRKSWLYIRVGAKFTGLGLLGILAAPFVLLYLIPYSCYRLYQRYKRR